MAKHDFPPATPSLPLSHSPNAPSRPVSAVRWHSAHSRFIGRALFSLIFIGATLAVGLPWWLGAARDGLKKVVWDGQRGASRPTPSDGGMSGNTGDAGRSVAFWAAQGPYAPYSSQSHRVSDTSLPEGCRVSQVNVLHRHTERYPTEGAGQLLRDALGRVQEGRHLRQSYRPEVAFLDSYDYNLTGWVYGEITTVGRQAAYDSGKAFRKRYGGGGSLPTTSGTFVRAASGQRVVDSAGFWMMGYQGKPFAEDAVLPKPHVIISEEPGMNNTLDVRTCPAAEAGVHGATESEAYRAVLADKLLPLMQDLLPTESPLQQSDVLALLSLCAFGRAAGNGTEGAGWCGLLKGFGEEAEQQAWEAYSHWYDVNKYYRQGEGSPYGPSSGAGYVNELTARLTDSTVQDETSTNTTLDGSRTTFPRGGERIFVDFTHDDNMIHIAAALGLFKQTRPLCATCLPDPASPSDFRMSALVPFGARWVFERVSCSSAAKGHGGDFVRVFVNDGITRIDHPACYASPLSSHGMCSLDAFLDSQAFSRRNGDWQRCYEGEQNDATGSADLEHTP